MRVIVLTLFSCFLAAAQWLDCPQGTQADCEEGYVSCFSAINVGPGGWYGRHDARCL